MNTIFLSVIIFLKILQYLIFFDVILSWLAIFGIVIRLKFIRSILDPLYRLVKTYIPTRFGAFDFTPIVLIFLLMFLRGIILTSVPGLQESLAQLMR